MVWAAAVTIKLSEADRRELESRSRRRKIALADAMRSEIILCAAKGLTNIAIAERLGVSRLTVATWRKRFAAQGLAGLSDEPRPGAPRQIGDDKIAEVVTKTLETMPTDATHWSTRSIAKASGVSVSTVHRIWQAFSLQPHRSPVCRCKAPKSRHDGPDLRRDAAAGGAVRPSSSLPIHCSWRKFATSSVSISPHRHERWCCASTKKPRSRRSIVSSRFFRFDQDRSSGGAMMTNGMGPHHYLQRST